MKKEFVIRLLKKLNLCLFAAILCAALPLSVLAEVSFSTEKEAASGYIGITGNPDFYPYEYYNIETGEYEGVFPALFELLSEKSGLNFQYVDCSLIDNRLVDQKTGYAQIISAYIPDGQMEDYNITNPIPVVSYDADGKEISICIAFGKYVEEDTVKKVTAAMNSISNEEIISLMGKYVNAKSSGRDFAIYVAIILALLIVIGLSAFALVHMIMKEGRNKSLLKKKEMLDPLTGIGNKKYFEKQFERMVAYQYKASYVLAFVGFDIKRVNKYYGDEKSEEQLCYAANLLTAEGRKKEVAARIAGGAFGILHVCSTEAEARDWGEELMSRLNVNRVEFNKDYIPKFRAGVYRLKTGKWDFAKAIKSAQKCYDLAVEQDANVFVSTDAMEQQNQLNEILSHDIAGAFEEHQIVQFLQPIVSVKTDAIIGAEGLARWRHPKLGLLHPGRFIPMMIEEEKIVELDMFLFEESCRRLAQWKQEGKKYRLSTNFARMSITSEDYVGRVGLIASKYDFIRENLVLEITEDSLENNKAVAMENLKAVKDMGFRIALDDMGSGFTFFSDLKDYPIDIVKVDRSMLLDAVDEKGKALMSGLIKVCAEMGMEIICEGVETAEQHDIVVDMGCDYIQGYYYFKPLSEEDAKQYM